MTDAADADATAPNPAGKPLHISMEAAELALATVMLIVIAAYLYFAWRLPAPYNPVDIGAAGFPTILGRATLIPVVLLWVKAAMRLANGQRHAPVAVGRPAAVLLTAVLMIGQAVFFPIINPFLCVGIFAVLIMLAAGERRPMHLLGVPAALTLGIWVIFDLILNVHFI